MIKKNAYMCKFEHLSFKEITEDDRFRFVLNYIGILAHETTHAILVNTSDKYAFEAISQAVELSAKARQLGVDWDKLVDELLCERINEMVTDLFIKYTDYGNNIGGIEIRKNNEVLDQAQLLLGQEKRRLLDAELGLACFDNEELNEVSNAFNESDIERVRLGQSVKDNSYMEGKYPNIQKIYDKNNGREK